jgi:hypothetical protein
MALTSVKVKDKPIRLFYRDGNPLASYKIQPKFSDIACTHLEDIDILIDMKGYSKPAMVRKSDFLVKNGRKTTSRFLTQMYGDDLGSALLTTIERDIFKTFTESKEVVLFT